MTEYEKALREMTRSGGEVPPGLVETVAELADSYGGR
jgi:hypothetical protein